MSYDTIIEGTVLYQGRLTNACIGVKDGKIAKVRKVIDGYERHDFGSHIILPAGIDIHVHFREPGATRKEDFQTGSQAALNGGVATVLDMPNNQPFINSKERFVEKRKLVARKSFVDFGLYASPFTQAEVPGLVEEGAAFKFFLAESTAMAQGMPSLEDIYQMLYTIDGKAVVAFHPEDGKIIAEREKAYEEKGLKRSPLEKHYYLRPPTAELSAVSWVKKIYKKMVREGKSPRFHLCHISSQLALGALVGHDQGASELTRDSLSALRGPVEGEEQPKEKGYVPPTEAWLDRNYSTPARLSFETAPHYIFLDKVMNAELGVFGKVNPSLKRDRDNAALWQALQKGAVDCVASDHAPHLPHEKESEESSGLPGVETMLPLFLKLVREDRLSLSAFVSLFSKRPALLFGLNKGEIEEGMDADLMVVDFHELSKVKGETLLSKCGWSPYEGREVIFPNATFVGGELKMKEGAIFGDKGTGKFLRLC